MADPNAERDPLEVLATEFIERLRSGQQPSISEYVAHHPDLAEDIKGLFPAIVATERLKASRERSSDGSVSLGVASLERLGDFRIIREIGRGGMGVVFEAEQESLGRRVAVKVLPRQALLDPKHLRRFHREARIAANLANDPKIPETLQRGCAEGGTSIARSFPAYLQTLRGHDGGKQCLDVLGKIGIAGDVLGNGGLLTPTEPLGELRGQHFQRITFVVRVSHAQPRQTSPALGPGFP